MESTACKNRTILALRYFQEGVLLTSSGEMRLKATILMCLKESVRAVNFIIL